jgi:pyrroloquinoline quinone (PQQ) biosynthesis protein C
LVFTAVLLQPKFGKKMQEEFHRTGQLKDITSYPIWLQDVVAATTPEKNRVVQHEFFALMRDGQIELPRVRQFFIGAWKTIEGFPQFMALNLQKIHFGRSKGEDMARRYLIQNIRVEQNHADHWVEWARAAGVTVDDLNAGRHSFKRHTLAHWCWYISSQPSLAVGMAATNFAVEGATGEWSCLVCSKDDYELSLPEKHRKSAMRWLRLHAEYDDIHPWEALDIIATLLGHEPSHADVDAITEAIRASYTYMALGLDESMAAL